jgi:hypothetical protein
VPFVWLTPIPSTFRVMGSSAIDLEVLLGILAIATFLVGFSTVRMQSSLQEWRERGERTVARLTEQNAGNDMLPLPTNLKVANDRRRLPGLGIITVLTLIATIGSGYIFFELTLALRGSNDVDIDRTLDRLEWLIGMILLIGVVDVVLVQSKAWSESRKSPARVFSRLETRLANWSRAKDKYRQRLIHVITEACDDFDDSITDWCWLSLIRFELQTYYTRSETHDSSGSHGKLRPIPFSESGFDIILVRNRTAQALMRSRSQSSNPLDRGIDLGLLRPNVERIRVTTSEGKNLDSYSLIAFVWSSLLLGAEYTTPINDEDLLRIAATWAYSGDIFAEMTLRRAVAVIEPNEWISSETLSGIEAQLKRLRPITLWSRITNRLIDPLRIVQVYSRNVR